MTTVDGDDVGTSGVRLGTSAVELGSIGVGLGSSDARLGTPGVGLGTSGVRLGTPSVGLGTSDVRLGIPGVGLGTSVRLGCGVVITANVCAELGTTSCEDCIVSSTVVGDTS